MLDDPRRSTIEKAGGPAQPQIFLTFDNMRAMRRECVFPASRVFARLVPGIRRPPSGGRARA